MSHKPFRCLRYISGIMDMYLFEELAYLKTSGNWWKILIYEILYNYVYTRAEWFPESLIGPVLGFNANSINSTKEYFLERDIKHLDFCLTFF